MGEREFVEKNGRKRKVNLLGENFHRLIGVEINFAFNVEI